MTESSQWFVRKGKKTHGPFTSRQLRKLARESQIAPDTAVRKGQDGSWVASQSIKGLFATEPIPSKTRMGPAEIEQTPTVVEPVQSKPDTQTNTGQLRSRWKPIAAAVVAAIIVTVCFAAFYPWLSLLCAIILLAGGIAFAAWAPVSERIASLRNRPCPSVLHRIYTAVPIVLYGVILLALSQSQIRSSWRDAEVRVEVGRQIEDANTALEQERVDEALKICNLLDSKANADEQSQVAAIRARAQTIQNANRVKEANDSVNRLLLECRQLANQFQFDKAQSVLDTALRTPFATEFQNATELADAIVTGRNKLAQTLNAKHAQTANDTVRQLLVDCHMHNIRLQFDEAQSTLGSAMQTPFATDFQNASELADAIVAGRTKLARKFLDAGNVAGAKEHAHQAVLVPSATDTTEAKQIITDISNREVAALVESARKALEATNRDEAAAALESALAIDHATETDEAEQMLADIRQARAKEANTRVTAMMADAQKSITRSEFADALRTLSAAKAVAYSTKNPDVTALIQTAEEAKRAAAERQDREKRMAEKKAVQAKIEQRLDQFVATLTEAGLKKTDIHSVAVEKDTAIITVPNIWHVRAYQIRLQDAQTLWNVWASIASPKDPDKARIKLVDFNGNEVGGSRILGGSLIWVQED